MKTETRVFVSVFILSNLTRSKGPKKWKLGGFEFSFLFFRFVQLFLNLFEKLKMKTLYGDFYMGMKTRLGCCSALHTQFPVPFSISSKDREIKTQKWIRTPEFQFSFSFAVRNSLSPLEIYFEGPTHFNIFWPTSFEFQQPEWFFKRCDCATESL